MVTKKKPSHSVARERQDSEDGAFPISASHTISAAEFKARCLAIMEEVREGGGEYVITKRGKPVARLVPMPVERRPLFGSMKGTVRFLGDIVSPLDIPWEAQEGLDDER
jgi:prevent-host-death family protein